MTSAQYPVCYQWDYTGMLTTGNLLSQGLTNSHFATSRDSEVTHDDIDSVWTREKGARLGFCCHTQKALTSPWMCRLAASHRSLEVLRLAADYNRREQPTLAPSRVCVFSFPAAKKARQQSLTLLPPTARAWLFLLDSAGHTVADPGPLSVLPKIYNKDQFKCCEWAALMLTRTEEY